MRTAPNTMEIVMSLIVSHGRRSSGSNFERHAKSLVAGLQRALSWPFEVAHARADLAKLGGLSDYELRDIGLSRQDLRNATALALDQDPTQFLAQAVRENSSALGGKRI